MDMAGAATGIMTDGAIMIAAGVTGSGAGTVNSTATTGTGTDRVPESKIRNGWQPGLPAVFLFVARSFENGAAELS